MDLNLCRKAYRISAGIYRKASHTLKYSTFSSNRPRAEQLGIVKSTLHRAHNLCDEGEPIENEVKLLNNALLQIDFIHRMVTELFLHLKIRREIKMRKRNFDVIPYVFHMFKDRQTC